MFGVLNLNKPLHCTSHDVVAQVRKKLGLKKVGHGGTLDPLAQGVLPICVGGATRLLEFFPSDKRYRAWITFGFTTLSWDDEGERLSEIDASSLSKASLENHLNAFQGTIDQQVPPHAAVHVKGKKLYEYTRRGIEVELPIREAMIYEIQLVELQQEGQEHPTAIIDIHCGSGTYIRSIAKALGEATGYGAYLSGLVRTAHGRFNIDQSIPLEDFLSSPSPEHFLLNPASYLSMPQIDLEQEALEKIHHGVKLEIETLGLKVKNDQPYLLLNQGWPAAIAKGESTGRLKPVKVFC